jgi:uncharacterized protein YjiS (DUF1127 family)
MHIPPRSSWSAIPGLASPVHDGRRARGLFRRAARLLDRAIRARRARGTEAELTAMSDRMLADIGVSRCDVERRARLGTGA